MGASQTAEGRSVLTPRILELLLKRIKPVIRIEGVLYYVQQPVGLDESYTWKALPANKVEQLELLWTSATVHTFAHSAHFVGTLREVFEQLPLNWDLLHQAVAVELVPPDLDSEEILAKAHKAGMHIATVSLYRRREL